MKHEKFIENLAMYMEPEIYVELGVYDGSTFNSVKPYVKDWSYGVDINPVMSEADKEAQHVNIYTMSTEDFSIFWKDNICLDIDLIFIDADHSKDAVLKDVSNFWPHLTPDTGLMILHDTWPLNKQQTAPGYSGDCYMVTSIIKSKYNCELLTIPKAYGLSFIRKIGKDWRNG